MPELRLTNYGYNFCVTCSETGNMVKPKQGVAVMMGEGDHTWVETIIMEEDQYENYIVATAIERGDKKTAKGELLDFEKEDRNLQGPFRIINEEEE